MMVRDGGWCLIFRLLVGDGRYILAGSGWLCVAVLFFGGGGW